MACKAAPTGDGLSGCVYTLAIGFPPLGILLSPSTIVPSVNCAINLISSVEDGMTRPRTCNILLDASKAFSTSSCSTCVIAVKNKLPKLCPDNSTPFVNRY